MFGRQHDVLREGNGDSIDAGKEGEEDEEEEEGGNKEPGVMLERGVAADAGNATAVSLERNAFLLGWVRLALAPPPAGAAAETTPQGDGREDAQPPRERAIDSDHGESDGGLAQGGGAPRRNGHAAEKVVNDETHETTGEARDWNSRRQQEQKKTTTHNMNKTREGPSAATPPTITPREETAPPSLRVGEDEAERGATTTTESQRVLRAGRGHVWFHVPSARLATELPESWVAFSGVSGGILADVRGSVVAYIAGGMFDWRDIGRERNGY